ncbi:histidine kinase [Pseudomonas sp. SDI]|uniref:histidine kinase n=1 Tax=Pseudomonas sp. SDI TaxID=2170734 RepID=UPI000DE6EBE0|nr:histidine kinase [Pseudomonas sp. SDI]PWB33210.1 histidine kinase [Pseudomonas sp. SDI]
MSALHDFLTDAQVLLARAEECLHHLELIGHDADACDCLVATLGHLASQARAQEQVQIAEFCEHLRQLLEPPACRERLQRECLNTLHECLKLVAWQLELIDPHTGQLGLDRQEQMQLLHTLSNTLDMPAPCATGHESTQSC